MAKALSMPWRMSVGYFATIEASLSELIVTRRVLITMMTGPVIDVDELIMTVSV